MMLAPKRLDQYLKYVYVTSSLQKYNFQKITQLKNLTLYLPFNF